AYMAPEVVSEQSLDLRADIFSMGVVFYEMLAGKNPFQASSMVVTFDRIRELSPESLVRLNPLVTPELARVVERMIEKDPAKRYPQSADALAALYEIKARLHAAAPPAHTVSRKKGTAVVACILLVAL